MGRMQCSAVAVMTSAKDRHELPVLLSYRYRYAGTTFSHQASRVSGTQSFP